LKEVPAGAVGPAHLAIGGDPVASDLEAAQFLDVQEDRLSRVSPGWLRS